MWRHDNSIQDKREKKETNMENIIERVNNQEVVKSASQSVSQSIVATRVSPFIDPSAIISVSVSAFGTVLYCTILNVPRVVAGATDLQLDVVVKAETPPTRVHAANNNCAVLVENFIMPIASIVSRYCIVLYCSE